MLKGPLQKKGYDWWWHNFTGVSKKTGEEKAFFIEYYVCNPAFGGNDPVFGASQVKLMATNETSKDKDIL